MQDINTLRQQELDNQTTRMVQDIRSTVPNPYDMSYSNSSLDVTPITPQRKNSPIELNPETVDPSLLYDTLSDGSRAARFDSYVTGIGEEQRAAESQTTANKWTRGIGKFFGKTGTAVLGSTIGSVYGLGAAVAEGDWDALWENDFQDVMDDWNKQMDNKLANYYTEEEKNMNFLQSAGTANFWANDFLGGLSFTAGAIIGEGIMASLTGGSSLAVRAGRWAARAGDIGLDALSIGKNIKNGAKPLKNYLSKFNATQVANATKAGKAAEALNTVRYMYTSAGYEAGVEARQFKKEQREAYEYNFENAYGRKPTPQERADFEANLNSSANTVFATNLALVGSSNLAVFGKMFNIANPIKAPKSMIRKTLFGQGVQKTEDGLRKAINRNVAQRIAGTTYSIFKAPFIEGVYEEGLQGVTSTAAGAFMDSTYQSDDSLSMIDSIYEGLSHTYGTKEGFKEVGLGMLIGAFGGGAANIGTGQNPFSAVQEAAAKTSKTDIRTAEILNTYSSKKLAEEMFRANRIAKSQEESWRGQKRADLFHAEAARKMGMMANIIYGENMGYGDEVADDFKTELENQDTATIAKNLNITEEEATQYKQDILDDYNRLRENFTKNREFANYIIGRGKIKDENLNEDVARDMLAYQQTMAEEAESLSEDFAKAIMAEVGDFNTYGIRLKSLFEVQNILRKAKNEDKDEFRTLQQEYKKTQRQLDELERKRTRASKLRTDRGNENQATQLNEISENIANAQERLTELEGQLEQSLSAMSLYGIEANEQFIISGKELANLEDNLQDIEKFLSATEEKNPEKAARIKALTQGYQNAIQGSRVYGEVIEDLLNPNTGLKGSTRTFLNKVKENNDPTQRLVDNLKKAQQGFAEGVSGEQGVFVDRNEGINDGINEGIADPTVDVTDTNVGDTVQSLTTVQKIQQEIDNLLNSNNYVLQNFGENLEDRKPKQEEVSRYEELLGKIKVAPDSLAAQSVDTIVKRGINNIGLNKEEITEFKELSQKLSDWQVIDGVRNSGTSLADLIEQKNAHKKEVIKREVETLDNQQQLEVSLGYMNSANGEMTSEMVNTAETVMMNIIKGEVHVSHLKLSDLTQKGGVVKKNGNPVEDLEKLNIGNYVVSFQDVDVAFRLDAHKRLVLKKGEFEKLSEQMDYKSFNIDEIKGSKWISVYQGTEEGYKMIPTKFTIEDVRNNFNILDPQALYSMKNGDNVYFKLSLTDSFNDQYRERLNIAFSNYEENPSEQNKKPLESLKSEIYKQVNIYIVNSNNDIIGQLKAIDDDVSETDTFRVIRKYAANTLIEKFDPDTPVITTTANLRTSEGGNYNQSVAQTVFSLPFASKVTAVFVGSPNLLIDENNQPILTGFTEGTLKMVDSFGVVENGEIQENKNHTIDRTKINTQFISKIKEATPFVVINYQNQKIAYPITIAPTSSSVLSQVEDIIVNTKNLSQGATDIINLLKENGIDPTPFNIYHVSRKDSFFNNQADMKRLEDFLNTHTMSVAKEDFLSKDYKKENLLTDGQIAVDLSNRPFQNAKLKIDLHSDIRFTREAEQEEINRFEITQIAEDATLESIANQLLSKKEEDLSVFHKNVLSLYRDEIMKRKEEKLKLNPTKKQQSTNQINKKCQEKIYITKSNK